MSLAIKIPDQLTNRGSHVISDYLMCQEFARLRHVLGLLPKPTPGAVAPRAFGSAWHATLEVYYWGKAALETDGKALEFLPEHFQPLFGAEWKGDCYTIADLAGRLALEEIREADEQSDEDEQYPRHLEMFEKSWPQYHEEVIEAEVGYFQTYLPNGKPLIEVEFEVPIVGNWSYTGRIDRCIHRLPQGKPNYYIRDYKTSAFGWVHNLEQDSRLNAQFSGYHLGIEGILGEWPAAVMVDVMEKPRRNMILSRWKPKFQTIPVTRTRAQVQDYMRDAADVLEEFDYKIELERTGRPVNWRKARNSFCINQFQRECPYLVFCVSPDRPIELFGLEDMFHLRKDEP